MANLTKSTGTVTLSGAVEKVTFPAVYGWVWAKNMSDADMFVGLSESVSAGADGVMRIPAGECGRVQTEGNGDVYLLGSGNALVVAQNYADCPFKVDGKGGEIPDLSAYAKKTDVPNIKVNEAVNADTVGGHSVDADVPADAKFTDTIPNLSEYAKKSDIPTELPANGGNADTVGRKSIDEIFFSAKYLNGISDVDNTDGNWSLGVVITATEEISGTFPPNCPDWAVINQYQTSIGKDFKIQTCQSVADNTRLWIRSKWALDAVWNDWVDVYTGSNKPYVTGNVTVAANSNVCVSNHGFTPSAVIWWDGNSSGVAVSLNDTQFVIDKTSAVDRTVYYMIFK